MGGQESQQLAMGVWPTAWGAMGGVMGPKGLRRIILPHYSPGDLRDLLKWEHPGAAADDKDFAALAKCCQAYFDGEAADFASVECDLSGVGPFGRAILATCRTVAYGKTLTYSALAQLAGHDGKQRAVARALGANPIPLVIPCHRIVAATGLGGFSAEGGVELKGRMLALEKKVTGGTDKP